MSRTAAKAVKQHGTRSRAARQRMRGQRNAPGVAAAGARLWRPMPSPAVQNRRSVAATQAAAHSAPRTGRVPARVPLVVSSRNAAACARVSWRARAVGAQRDVEEVKGRGYHDAGQQRRQSGAPRGAKRVGRKRPRHVEQYEQQQEDRQREGCAKQRLRRTGASAARGGRAAGACSVRCGAKSA